MSHNLCLEKQKLGLGDKSVKSINSSCDLGRFKKMKIDFVFNLHNNMTASQEFVPKKAQSCQ